MKKAAVALVIVVVAAVAVIALKGGGAKPPAQRDYTVHVTADKKPPMLKVTGMIPGHWTETLDPMGCPTYTIPGVEGAHLALAAIFAKGDDDKARIESALKLQYGEDERPKLTRAPRPDGRLWVVSNKSPNNAHARMFLPGPDGTVLMCVGMIYKGDAAQFLSTVEPVFETVRVTAGK